MAKQVAGYLRACKTSVNVTDSRQPQNHRAGRTDSMTDAKDRVTGPARFSEWEEKTGSSSSSLHSQPVCVPGGTSFK